MPTTEGPSQADAAAEEEPIFNFSDSLFPTTGCHIKFRMTRVQKQDNRRRYCSQATGSVPVPNTLDISVEDIKALQNQDETLK